MLPGISPLRRFSRHTWLLLLGVNLVAAVVLTATDLTHGEEDLYDVVVYDATSGGVMAAVAAARRQASTFLMFGSLLYYISLY